MALTVGARLGPYEILALLGAGGMGEVYRARDTKLGRDVAIKVLLPEVANDPDRLARFKREAQVLASLNHPHIAHIHGLEDADGVKALVLELVEGEDLAQRIARGPIPLDEALAVAMQIAEALEAAHEQGIIHRDLKPANIKVRDDGTVKVLDFGLAKAIEPSSSVGMNVTASPTITTPAMMTGVGVVLGTAAYMSPEQAKGRNADKRSDVWAFGCVLFEMLTAARAFGGDDVADTLAAVLRAEVDVTALPAHTPLAIRLLIARCLVKDRRLRVADLSVARFVLAEAANMAPAAASLLMPPSTRGQSRSFLLVAVAIVVTAMLVGGAAWSLWPSRPSSPVARFALELPDDQHAAMATHRAVAITQDGTRLVYVGNDHLFLRSLAEFEGQRIGNIAAGSRSAAVAFTDPTFSPDGSMLAFYSSVDHAVKRVAFNGGAAFTVCSVDATTGLAWDVSGIVVGQGSKGVLRCPSEGGSPERLATAKEDEVVQNPQILPGGSVLLFSIAKVSDGRDRWDKGQVVTQTIAGGERKTIVDRGSAAHYVRTGHLLYLVNGVMFAQPFDATRQITLGNAVPVLEGVRRGISDSVGAAQFDTSDTGTLLYIPGSAGPRSTAHGIALGDRAGQVTRLKIAPGPYVHVRASRDGTHLAIGTDDGKEASVWIYALPETTTMRRLTLVGQNRFPIWSPDGQFVAFQSNREGDLGIFRQRADGAGSVERLTKAAQGEAHVPESWSPDGQHIAFAQQKGANFTLWVLSIDDKKATPFGGVQSVEPIGSVFSPDGRWIAYSSTPTPTIAGELSTDRGVYIQPFPAASARYQLPRQALDFHPVWGPKGTELVVVPTVFNSRFAAVPLTTQPNVAFGTASSLPAKVTGDRRAGETRAFDIMPDGRFVGLVSISDKEPIALTDAAQIRVVLNWFEELKRLVPAK
jgi:Tol biopolymer transport system component